MLTRQLTRSTRPPRRGLAATETLLVLPIFLLLLTGMVGFADLLIAEQKMDEASGRAARVVAMGGTDEQIKAAVCSVLGPERAKHVKIIITPIDGCHDGSDKDDDKDDKDKKKTKKKDKQKKDDSDDDKDDHDGYDDDKYDDDRDDKNDDRHNGSRHMGLVEVRVELDVKHATVTRLVPICRGGKLIGRTVVHRQ